MSADTIYFQIVEDVLRRGRLKKNRTGVDTIGTFGTQVSFDLTEGFPLLTTKKVHYKAIIHELLWFLAGDTNIKYLVDNDVRIWNEWAHAKYLKTPIEKLMEEETSKDGWHRVHASLEDFVKAVKNNPTFAKKWGELGEGTYGGMWRAFPYTDFTGGTTFNSSGQPLPARAEGTVDQIQKVVDKLKTNPDDRRLIVSAWHPYWVDHCALPPCHCLFQFHTEELTDNERWEWAAKNHNPYVSPQEFILRGHIDEVMNRAGIPKRRLNCKLTQRSCDVFLGVPFNIASYAMLLSMMAHVSNMVPGEFIWSGGDVHIYTNHLDQIQEQSKREPRPAPRLKLNPAVKNIFDFKYEDITIEGYDPHPAIKGQVAV